MIQIIICSIILIVVGILLLKFPNHVFELTQSWKNASVTEPSSLYIISTRISGIICVGIGVVCLIIGIVILDRDSNWDVTYKNPNTYEYNYWIFNKDGNLNCTTYGTYSFDEKKGQVILCEKPEVIDSNDYSNEYVLSTTEEGYLQLIPEMYYFNPDSSFGSSGGKLLTIEDVTREFVSKSGKIDESKRPSNATYQLIQDGKEMPMFYYFHSDGTYKSVQSLKYRVKRNNVIRIEGVNYSYSIHPITNELTIYFDELNLVLEKQVDAVDLYLDDFTVTQ